MVAPADAPARFAFNILGTIVNLDAHLRSGTDYGLTVAATNISEGLAIRGTTVTFWGVPADPRHDAERRCPGTTDNGCTTQEPLKPFLRNPTSCPPLGTGLTTTLSMDSWTHPGLFVGATTVSHLSPAEGGAVRGTTDCDQVPFDPTLSAQPNSPNSSAQAGAPSGWSFDLTVPQNELPDGIGEGDVRKAVVTLPEGVRVSPSSADGLGACAPADIRLNDASVPSCPDASKLGTVRIETPLLNAPLDGAVYLAKPHDNPFGSLLAVYLVARGQGLVVKLPGSVNADPVSGQLTATFDDNPQLPFSNLHLEFKEGPRAPLVNPSACGTYTTHTTLTSWSGRTVPSDSSFALTGGQNGASCPTGGFSPSFSAGTTNPVAGEHSSFLLSLSRQDADQELRSLNVDMPKGLVATLKGVPLCPEAQAAAGTCGAGSRIGTVTSGAGAGTRPFFLDGKAYITGPYKGGPFGLSIVVPAVAGPFDLGLVVVRAAIQIDRKTTALRIVSDPLPTILQGIPLQVRVIRVAVDRPDFILNPTSCAEKQVRAQVASTGGKQAAVGSRFQVGNCNRLTLAPRMRLAIGAKHRTGANISTPLVTTLTQTPGQSNLKSVSVTLPLTLNSRLGVVGDACTLSAFHANDCAKAKVGSAVAVSPLLDDPLSGSAYLVKNPARPLPDLMVALRGQVDVDLTGKISTPGDVRLATTFATIPDVPITRFTLRINAGKQGPIGTAENLCTFKASQARAKLAYRAQNGRKLTIYQAPKIRGCPKR